MSLLLDALKKAANDKKKSVDEPADESLAQDNSRANDEDSLELELDENNDFPQVEDPPIVSQTQRVPSPADNHAVTDSVSESTNEPQAHASQNQHTKHTAKQTDSDTVPTEQATELELTPTQNADSDVIDITDESYAESQQSESLTSSTAADSVSIDATSTDTDTQATDQSSAAVAAHTINPVNQTGRARHSTDNEAALSALINKSNQYQQRAQKKRTLLLATLILLLISGSALFFYLKTEMASHELYIAQNNSSPLLREAAATSNRSQSTADNQTVLKGTDDGEQLTPNHTHNTEITTHSHSTEQAVNKPRSTQNVKSQRTAVTNRDIHIQQSSREDPLESLIMDGYNAFQRGDYGRAETLYQQVLVDEPRNRDAMLGLAAIALKQQRYEYARQKYQALLQLNPRDSLAIAGLGSLQHLPDAALSESQLKFMLKEQPDASHLYFALGSLYAGKDQWPQAQSAYFSAWSTDPNNADYAFNLAVSLDHINQPQQALQYYQLSLKLMRSSAANFSATQVQQRINSLQEALR